jgi:acyl carrier protein phosphodiesterase
VNFLAHLHLADPEPGLMLGGVVADFARNAEVAALPEDVRRGVQLHRLIDGFTDRHFVVGRSCSRVSRRLGWFSGIVIDIYYDHILARNWHRYSGEPLGEFAARAYRVLGAHFATATPDAQYFLRKFIDHDQIAEYATTAGITLTLTRVARLIAERIPKRAVWLPDAVPDLLAVHDLLEADFNTFYPELVAFAGEHRRTLGEGHSG